MNIDIQTARVLLCKINDKLNEIIVEDNNVDWYWCVKSCYSNNVNLRYGKIDNRKNLSFRIKDNIVEFEIEYKTFKYYIPFKSQNWFEKLFYKQSVDCDDVIYKEANSIIDFAFKKLEEKQKNKDLKFLNEFLKNS